MSNEDQQPAPAPGSGHAPRVWPRVVAATAVLAFLGAGVGTAFGLARSTDDGNRAATPPASSVTQSPTPVASGSESSGSTQCTSDCPTQAPDPRDPTVTVPHVVGHDEAAARKRFEESRLSAQVKYVCSGSGPVGTVTAQSPRGGTEVKRDSTVSLDVRGAWVPNVVGKYYGDAKAYLEEAGFTVVINNRRPGTAGGSVSSQSPAANSCVKAGSTVTITVGQPTASPTPSGTP